MKYFYRILILLGVFIGSVWFMGRNMKEEKFTLRSTVEMSEATFPTVDLVVGDNRINTLYGYAGNVDVGSFRESMLPLDTTQSFVMEINENQTVIKKVMYELIDIATDNVLDSGTISALDKKDDKRTVKITIKETMESDKEYALKLTTVTDTSKKITFVTRVKRLENSYLAQKLAFVEQFHAATLDKEEFQSYTSYLNPRKLTVDNSTLNRVTIESGTELVTWSVMEPEVIETFIPTVKEIDQETMSVQLRYVVKAKDLDTEGNVIEDSTSQYCVEEFYRIRYSKTKTWLLAYERTIEEVFDFNQADLSKGTIPLGVSHTNEINMMSSENNQCVSFVRNGTLWYYQLDNNKAVRVFSFGEDAYSAGYNEHDIRILKLDDKGNIDFVVYGYMAAGDYEGRIGLVAYKYYRQENRIEEQVFIPLQEPYEVVRENVAGFSYLSDLDIFYFSVNDVIYSYNVNNNALTTIANDVKKDSYMLSDKGQFIAWQNASNIMESTKISILNLETEENYAILAGAEEQIKVLGVFNQYVIYGIANATDILRDMNGSNDIVPYYKVAIADSKGNVVKEYASEGFYVTKIQVKDNVIELNRVRKNGAVYEEVDKDYIMNQIVESKKKITSEEVMYGKLLKEQFIVLTEGFSVEKVPKYTTTVQTIITEDSTVHFEEYYSNDIKYYVYATGHLVDAYESAAEAIQVADSMMGVVMDSNNYVVWERGIRATKNSINALTPVYSDGQLDSVGAALTMLLKYNQIAVDAELIMDQQESMYGILEKYMDTDPVNLTGCSLNQVLYYLNKKRPVIAMKNATQAVLITGYDEGSITIIDPLNSTNTKMGMTAATDMFNAAGNVFIGYTK